MTLVGFDPEAAARISALLDSGEFPAATEALRAATPQSLGQRVDHHMVSGKAAAYMGRFHEAREHFVRALWMGRRLPISRVRMRASLCNILLHAGDLARSERELRRALTEVRSNHTDLEWEPRLLTYLGGIYRRRGMIRFSIQTQEEAVKLARSLGIAQWGGFAANLANALFIHGELDRSRDLLEELLAHPEVFFPGQFPYIRTLLAIHAIETDDLDRAEQALNPMLKEIDRLEASPKVTCKQVESMILIRRGRYDEAISKMEKLVAEIENEPALAVMTPAVLNQLAEGYLGLNRCDEALRHAQRAIALSRTSDLFDQAAALRIAARCHAALNHHDVARTTLAEAHAVLEASEAEIEKRNLRKTARLLGIELPGTMRTDADRSRIEFPQAEPSWIALRDGRSFLTTDPRLLLQIRRSAADDIPVLIEGETGTGKELVAHLIHELGTKSDRPLVVVDCTMLTDELAEAELFGAVRGAYTGAVNREGLVEAADGGTLFLDELTELSLVLQAKLLRLLQEGTFRRLGDPRVRKVRTRIVAATNRSVETLVESGGVRQDLFYRLKGHRLRLHPLRERPQEIRLLADQIAREAGLLGISTEAHRRLAAYTWPGNVRELQMMIRVSASRVGLGGWLELDELDAAGLGGGMPHPLSTYRNDRRSSERDSLERALHANGGNVAAAARSVGISRQAFYKAMRRTGGRR